MSTINFCDGTKRHLPRRKKKRYENLKRELVYRLPKMDPAAIEKSAWIMALAGLDVFKEHVWDIEEVLFKEVDFNQFQDILDYNLPIDDVERIALHCKLSPPVKKCLRNYPKRIQKQIVKEFLNMTGDMTYEVYELWNSIPRSRSIILEKLEELEDLQQIKFHQLPRVLTIHSRNEPWSRRKKRCSEWLFSLVPKEYFGRLNYEWRKGDPPIERVYNEIISVANHNHQYFVE